MSNIDELFTEEPKEKPQPPIPPAVTPPTPSEPPKPTAPSDDMFPSTVQTETKRSRQHVSPSSLPAEDFFKIVRAEPGQKEVFTIYGHKGHGKTALALWLPGTILAFSYDHKTADIHEKMFNNDPRITVIDALAYEDASDSEAWLISGDRTFRYVQWCLEQTEFKANRPDWILHDGSEIMQQKAELAMRFRNNFKAFEGFANRTYWKERNLYVRQIHKMSQALAKRGVVYTTYVDKEDIMVNEQIKAKSGVPKWVDAILTETDTVIRVRSSSDASGRRFYAEVESSKKRLQTGLEKDITNIGMKAFGVV